MSGCTWFKAWLTINFSLMIFPHNNSILSKLNCSTNRNDLSLIEHKNHGIPCHHGMFNGAG